MEKKKLKLITHDGPFHTDDIFAVATLSMLLEKEGKEFQIIRTREPEIIEGGDYVFDVGGVYDEATNKFDHHQIGGAGVRSVDGTNIEYAAFGLVWKKFGLELCGDQKVVDWIDKKFAMPIDADDNGFSVFDKRYKVSPFLIQDFFFLMRPTWKESSADFDKNFLKAVNIAKEILLRSIVHGQGRVEAEARVIQVYQNTKDKRIVILDKYCPFSDVLVELPEPLFVIYPKDNQRDWCVKAVQEKGKDFKNRKDLPIAWAGFRDEELQKITGVSDAIFCHRALFLAVAKSKEGAVKLAQIALES